MAAGVAFAASSPDPARRATDVSTGNNTQTQHPHFKLKRRQSRKQKHVNFDSIILFLRQSHRRATDVSNGRSKQQKRPWLIYNLAYYHILYYTII